MKKVILISLIILLIASCSTPAPVQILTKTITVKDTVYTVQPPTIKDSDFFQIATDDSLIYEKIEKTEVSDKDTTIKLKVYPRLKKFDLTVKPEPVKLLIHDTTTITNEIKEKNEEMSITDKLTLAVIGACVMLLIVYLIKK